jgi:hypothetical protein
VQIVHRIFNLSAYDRDAMTRIPLVIPLFNCSPV